MSSVVISGDTSGAITLSAPAVAGTNTITLPAATGTVQINNGPAFAAYSGSGQNFTTSTFTKVTLDTEIFDTNNNFASSRFTPTVAGYYQINGGVHLSNTSAYMTNAVTAIYKNGSLYTKSQINMGSAGNINDTTYCVSAVIYLNGSTDYVELYTYEVAGGTPQVVGGTTYDTQMSGCLLRTA
jgi:hypothetical protein